MKFIKNITDENIEGVEVEVDGVISRFDLPAGDVNILKDYLKKVMNMTFSKLVTRAIERSTRKCCNGSQIGKRRKHRLRPIQSRRRSRNLRQRRKQRNKKDLSELCFPGLEV